MTLERSVDLIETSIRECVEAIDQDTCSRICHRKPMCHCHHMLLTNSHIIEVGNLVEAKMPYHFHSRHISRQKVKIRTTENTAVNQPTQFIEIIEGELWVHV